MLAKTLYLGVDGGNTKTVALLSDDRGTILGWGKSGCSDLYASGSAGRAVDAIDVATSEALDHVGAGSSDLAAAGFSLAGADWPEDFVLLSSELARLFGGTEIQLVNDAIGAIYASSTAGFGVSAVCGTWAVAGARSPSGSVWHSSWWTEASGATGIAGDALRAVYRASLGLGPETSLVARALEFFSEPDVESLLHSFTRRDDRRPRADVALFARATLDEAELGDPTAAELVEAHGRLIAEYALVATRKVGLQSAKFPLILAGGVFQHPSNLLARTISNTLQAQVPGATSVMSELPPVVGALLLAFRASQQKIAEIRDRVQQTIPRESLLASDAPSDATHVSPDIPGVA